MRDAGAPNQFPSSLHILMSPTLHPSEEKSRIQATSSITVSSDTSPSKRQKKVLNDGEVVRNTRDIEGKKFAEVNNRNTSHVIRRCSYNPSLKSCLKRRPVQSEKMSPNRRHIKFAVSADDPDEVLCFIEEYEKLEGPLLESLFWTHDELYETFVEDTEKLELAKSIYCQALEEAFSQSSSAMSSDVYIQLDLSDCSDARGLELDVFPNLKLMTSKHRKAVLIVQEVLRDQGQNLGDDHAAEMIRKASARYSRPSRLVAMKIGENDANVI